MYDLIPGVDGDKAHPRTFLTPYKFNNASGVSLDTGFQSWKFQDNASGVQPPYAEMTRQAQILIGSDPTKNYEVKILWHFTVLQLRTGLPLYSLIFHGSLSVSLSFHLSTRMLCPLPALLLLYCLPLTVFLSGSFGRLQH
jgi:hypothetical protein